MIQTGIVTGSTYEKNRDGSRQVLMLQVRLTSKDDVQTVEYMQGAGDSDRPYNGVKVLVINNGPAYKIAIACDDLTLVKLELGERAIRSVVSGEVKASVLCNQAGAVVLNNGVDFAVAFNELKTVVDSLVNQLNLHVHGASGSPPTVQMQADITPAKVEKVNL